MMIILCAESYLNIFIINVKYINESTIINLSMRTPVKSEWPLPQACIHCCSLLSPHDSTWPLHSLARTDHAWSESLARKTALHHLLESFVFSKDQ